jgi:Amt family ammonium transporter
MFRKNLYFPLLVTLSVTASLGFLTTDAWAQEGAPQAGTADTADDVDEASPAIDIGELQYAFDNGFLFICAVLVFFMQAGFAMVEAGFNSSKNSVNILFKNSMDVCVGVLLFWLVGYGLMYPGEFNGILGFAGFGIAESSAGSGPGDLSPQVDWLFQVVFAATAATIVSGAVAGRMKFSGYLIYTVFLTALIYPISGSWKWGGGWLDSMGFYDFAGSVVVHAVGGFAGLAGALVLGPRLGRFTAEGKPVDMPGHSIPLAALGVFILWMGWYGFNPGSQLVFSGKSDIDTTMLVAANTTLAAGAGGVFAMLASWLIFKKPSLAMALNGILGGLVGITANCDGVTNVEAMVIGGIAGLLVVLSIIILDYLTIDDAVGAFPVHGVCGVWGGIATGIFGNYGGETANIVAQIAGCIAIPLWAFGTMFILFSTMNKIGILRVSHEDEKVGLDLAEHGESAYYH